MKDFSLFSIKRFDSDCTPGKDTTIFIVYHYSYGSKHFISKKVVFSIKFKQGGCYPMNQGKVRENEKELKWPGKVREFGKERGKSGNLNRLSEPKSSSTPQVQLHDLSFFQNAISKS